MTPFNGITLESDLLCEPGLCIGYAPGQWMPAYMGRIGELIDLIRDGYPIERVRLHPADVAEIAAAAVTH